MKKHLFFALFLVVLAAACRKVMPGLPNDDETLDGPVEGLSAEERARFIRGDIAFNDEIFTPETGLGPVFVAGSCGSCHAGDGKGHPFTSLVRFGQVDGNGNQYLDKGGPQLQHRAIPGFTPEQVPAGASATRILPPANTGLGYIDAVTDADILGMADPDDADGDGISGEVNWISTPSYCQYRINSVAVGGKHIGRFGRKGAAYDLLQQTANAYNQDMGISSSFEPRDTYSGNETEPEVSNQTVHDVVFYLRALKAPVQRIPDDPDVVEGKKLFVQTGCEKCHKSTLKTGDYPLAPIANKTFHPYTDLLMHDMGPALDDNYTEGSAKTYEWRTPALWGLGLSKNSQGGSYFLMHDGRAHSIEEAIELHGGEGTQSRDSYRKLSGDGKRQLIRFLESL